MILSDEQVEDVRAEARRILAEEMELHSLNASIIPAVLAGKYDQGPAIRAIFRSVRDLWIATGKL